MKFMKGTVLIIDDEDKLRQLLARVITLEDYKVLEAANAKAGLSILEKEEIQVVISDVKLPDANGIDLVSKIKKQYPYIEIIVMTAYGTIQDGVKAMKYGASDYITKGEGEEQIIPAVSRAMERAQLQFRILHLEKKLSEPYNFDAIIGNAPSIMKAVELAKKVAITDATVLLLGETGTGKEVFAQAIHYASMRKQQNFVAINCSAIPKDLIESDLFGYKAGAFTGAIKDKKGLFEEANKGTIFLDEIGELNMDLQAKLLRVLETHTFIKSGDTKETKVDVRVIAATNRDLFKESEQGHFRSDLYYRLSTFLIQLPPLRERSEDVEAIVRHFLKVYAPTVNKKIKGFDKDFLKKLQRYSFKGNIRELKNIIERAVILCDADTLTSDLLPPEINRSDAASTFDLATVERNHILSVLQHVQGNKTKAAELLGIGVATLYRKIEEYKLS